MIGSVGNSPANETSNFQKRSEEEIKLNRELMSAPMKAFDEENRKRTLLNRFEYSKKTYYIGDTLETFFSEDGVIGIIRDVETFSNEWRFLEKVFPYTRIKILSKLSYSNLDIVFRWTLDHFAELDLGGNNKHYECLVDVSRKILSGKWDKKAQSAIKLKYISMTRWYQKPQA